MVQVAMVHFFFLIRKVVDALRGDQRTLDDGVFVGNLVGECVGEKVGALVGRAVGGFVTWAVTEQSKRGKVFPLSVTANGDVVKRVRIASGVVASPVSIKRAAQPAAETNNKHG